MDKLEINITAKRKPEGGVGNFSVALSVTVDEKRDESSLSMRELVETNFLLLQVANLVYDGSTSIALNKFMGEGKKDEKKQKKNKKN